MSFYNNNNGTFTNYNLDCSVVSAIEINDTTLALWTYKKGKYELQSLNLNNFKLIKINIDLQYRGIYFSKLIKQDFLGRSWIVGTNSIMQIIQNGTNLSKPIITTKNEEIITDFDVSPTGKMIYSTEKYIYILDQNFEVVNRIDLSKYGHSKIFNVKLDINNIIWIASRDKMGFASFNLNSNKYINLKLSYLKQPFTFTNSSCLLIDKSGVIWLGSDGGGVTKYNPYQRKFKLLKHEPGNPNSLSTNFPKSMFVDSKNNLWVGTIKGGLNKYNIDENKWEHFSITQKGKYYIKKDNVIRVIEDSQGRIWNSGHTTETNEVNSSQYYSIDTLDNKTGGFKTFKENHGSNYIFESSHKKVYLSLKRVITSYDLNNKTFNELDHKTDSLIKFSQIRSYCMEETFDKHLWYGTGNGVYRFDQNLKLIKNYSNQEGNQYSLSHNFVISMMRDIQGRLWLGTRDGLNLYNPSNDNFIRFDVDKGLPNSFIYGIIEDKNNDIWLSTNKGLSRLTFRDTNHYRFRNYKLTDGLQSYEFNTDAYTKSKNGYLFFGGIGGITYFHPDSLKDNQNIPNVVITTINLFDLPYKTEISPEFIEELRLNYNENTLSFEFAALEYSFPAANQYSYYMVGVDTGWVYSGDKRFARYANLKPGTYTFRVKASNNDGIWNEVGTSVKVIILPPFWATTEFRIMVILIVLILVVVIYKFRVYNIQQRNQYLETSISQRTEELRNKNILLEQQTVAIKRINETLEKRVEERTLELQEANRKLQEILQEVKDSKFESIKAIVKAQEDERARFAKDLHDGASQYLTFLKFNINNVISKIDDTNKIVKDNLREQLKLIDNIVQDLRQFAYSLMPPVLERIGLKPALEELLEMIKSSTNIRVEYYLQDKRRPLPKYYKIQVYRVVQEILNNSIKHSKCTQLSLQLLSFPSNILIIIEDNGVGFDLTTVKQGMGLKNLYSRLALINGKIDIDSQINHGTTITIEVPN